MILLDVSFGIFAFLPQGWLFMAFVILIECIIMTKILKQNWFDKRIYGIATLTNLISGAVGIITTMILNGGWFLVVWFPWVSSNEINISKGENLKGLIIFYFVAFILSVILESFTNWLFLRKKFETKQILTTTLIANIVSYTIGTIVLYSYSFR
ncbi:MAG: hypothetical protein P4L34_01370 [Paludibacter sp.]|nr:hypothetical protein [Paludibacter sp.]